MTTAQMTPTAPRIDEDIIERGDWTKERHELGLTEAEFVADILRLQAEHRLTAPNSKSVSTPPPTSRVVGL